MAPIHRRAVVDGAVEPCSGRRIGVRSIPSGSSGRAFRAGPRDNGAHNRVRSRRPIRRRVGAVADIATPSNPRGRHGESLLRPKPLFQLPTGGPGERAMTSLRRDIASLPDLLHGHARAGAVRERRPEYVTCCRRAIRAVRPERTSRAGSPTCRRTSTSWRGARSPPTIPSPRSTGASATTRARASATGPSSTARSRSTRSSATWATWRSSGAGSSIRRPRPAASGCS